MWTLEKIRERYPDLQYRLLQPINDLPSIKHFNSEINNIVCSDTNKATPLSINVFVIVAELNSNINIKKLWELYCTDTDKDESFKIKYDPESKKSKVKKIGKESFYNCIQISTVIDNNNINIKIFPNGKMQIAGCRTIALCHKVPKVALKFITHYHQAIINKNCCALSNQRIVMINSQFNFKFSLNKIELKNIIRCNCKND